jgi:hypothetical protein
MKEDNCRSCKAKIVWAETLKGRRMPLDPKPVADGNVEVKERGRALPLAIVMTNVPTGGALRFKSHFATCPQASKWRSQS